MWTIVPPDKTSYSYAGVGYANPHAVTQIATGQSTTTYSYDHATTTYGYDAFGTRVFQSTATSTTLYPFKCYSVASSTGSSAAYATTTEYIFNGDALLSTIDQQLAGGVATGTAQTRYIHPDHLGSTNVVTNASGTMVQTLDYYPYGATRINSGRNAENRQYIGQFSDQSRLLYLQARYQDPQRGQFLSQDPMFWSTQPNLSDPQSLNSYSYANGNPISEKDPDGKFAWVPAILLAGEAYGALELTYYTALDWDSNTFRPNRYTILIERTFVEVQGTQRQWRVRD